MKKVTAEIIKVLPLKKDCYYIVFIPLTAGLSTTTLEAINHELEKEDYMCILVLTKDNTGIDVIERKNG